MSRLTDAADEVPPKPPPGMRCGVAKIRADFDEQDREFFDRLLVEVLEGKRTATSVSRILSRIGISYRGNNLTYHLRGECSCGKPVVP